MRLEPRRAMLLGWLLLSASAVAAEGWETITTDPIVVKTRPLPSSAVHEVWAEGDMGVPVAILQEVLMDTESFPKFMPYVKEARFILKPHEDGGRYVYTRVNLPMVSERDYVTKVNLDESVKPDGSGSFKNRWVATPSIIPSRHNIIRLQTNRGSWHVTPLPNGRSHVVYRFAVDPGGAIPAFAANMGNRSAVPDTFKAVETEARRRLAARKSKPATDAGKLASP